MTVTHAFWGVVPAAGVGKRMGADLPKQYLQVNGKPVLQHTLERLLSAEAFSAIAVALGLLALGSLGLDFWRSR